MSRLRPPPRRESAGDRARRRAPRRPGEQLLVPGIALAHSCRSGPSANRGDSRSSVRTRWSFLRARARARTGRVLLHLPTAPPDLLLRSGEILEGSFVNGSPSTMGTLTTPTSVIWSAISRSCAKLFSSSESFSRARDVCRSSRDASYFHSRTRAGSRPPRARTRHVRWMAPDRRAGGSRRVVGRREVVDEFSRPAPRASRRPGRRSRTGRRPPEPGRPATKRL